MVDNIIHLLNTMLFKEIETFKIIFNLEMDLNKLLHEIIH